MLVLVLVAVVVTIAFRFIVSVTTPAPPGRRVVLWHSQRGNEKAVLEERIRAFNAAHAGELYVEPLSVPDASFKDKLLRTIPRGGGPDVFIRPHNELGELVADKVLLPIDDATLPYAPSEYLKGLLEGVSVGDERYGVPLTFKALFLFYNTKLLPDGPPKSVEELVAMRPSLSSGTFPLAYDAQTFFFHAPFFLASGGKVFDGSKEEKFALFDDVAVESFYLPGQLRAVDAIPPEPTYNEMIRLFESGQAAAIICGPWYAPSGPIAAQKAWQVAPLPTFKGRRMGSFATIDAAFIASSARSRSDAALVVRFLGDKDAQVARFEAAALPPVTQDHYTGAGVATNKDAPATRVAQASRSSLEHGMVTPSSTRMGAVWRPGDDVLKASAAGRDVAAALDSARYSLDQVASGQPPARSFTLAGVILVALLLGLSVLLVKQVRTDMAAPEAARSRLIGSWGQAALAYLAPGVVATGILVLVPAVAAAAMSLFEYDHGTFVFVGLENFRTILLPPLDHAFEARSFYFALGVTVLWTVLNVALHLGFGVFFALLLRPTWVKLRTPFRLVLVLPWAIPNYITALMWKGMFNAQVGAINALLAPFGFEGYAWFDRFLPAFFANLVTNTWLGFPFMMVVTLGALTSLPKEIEEASILDGASRVQRLVHIVLPHIRPALVPSVILGSVWTFNMFNVVYLVSGGEPGSQTDILVSEAYRWAFERGQRYGFAAAYSVLIFVVLVIYGRATRSAAKEDL